MGAASMIVFPEPVGRSLLKLVEVTDAELSKFLSNCLSLKSDYVIRNRALRKLAANALTIESLEHGFAFEDIGTGFSRTTFGAFFWSVWTLPVQPTIWIPTCLRSNAPSRTVKNRDSSVPWAKPKRSSYPHLHLPPTRKAPLSIC